MSNGWRCTDCQQGHCGHCPNDGACSCTHIDPLRLDAEELMRKMITVLQDHFWRDSLLDGSASCPRCAALMLRRNAERHEEWHKALEREGRHGRQPGSALA